MEVYDKLVRDQLMLYGAFVTMGVTLILYLAAHMAKKAKHGQFRKILLTAPHLIEYETIQKKLVEKRPFDGEEIEVLESILQRESYTSPEIKAIKGKYYSLEFLRKTFLILACFLSFLLTVYFLYWGYLTFLK